MAGGAKLQDAASSTGNGNVVNCLGIAGTYRLTLIGAGTISAGGVTWEQNPISATYSGTWEPLAAELTPVDATVVSAAFTGVVHYVRARVSTAVTGGGTVTARMQAPVGDAA